MDLSKLQAQLDDNRRSVAFDSYDITIMQLLSMIEEGMIDIAPEYQRHFVWDEVRQSQLVESFFLGIPVPNVFMATNKDSSWEVIDGLQRLTTIVNFIGSDSLIKKTNAKGYKLKIKGLEKIDYLNGCYFEELPKSIQLMFKTRPFRVTVLNDRSDFEVRYDLFERLNTGGVTLHPQEIRNCVYLGPFKEFIQECSESQNFLSVVKMTKNAELTGNREELVLKFFAYYEDRDHFVHSVKEFLNDFMEKKTKKFDELEEYEYLFTETFKVLNDLLPDGIVRGNRKKATPLVLFEAISIGVADLIKSGESDLLVSNTLQGLLNDPKLTSLTTGATNSNKKLLERIDYVKRVLRK